MISIKRLWLLVTTIVVTGFSLVTVPLFAQEEREGIGISPTTLTLAADPGAELNGQITVINSGTSAIQYKVYVNDFGIRNEEYEKDFESIPGANSPVSWISLPTDTLDLAAGAQIKLDYTIKIPADAVPQGYYAVIFAETAVPEVDATGVARIKRVGSLVYLTVNGGSISKGEYLGFSSKLWNREKNVKPSIRIQNSGNVHFDATGEVRLKDILGRTLSIGTINGTLLPQTVRKFAPTLQTKLPVGLYRIEGQVKFLDQDIDLGTRWVLVGSTLALLLTVLILAAWIYVIIFWIKRRGRRKKA